ncbi:hypothetical protein FXO37_21445 [Capsicum annuum]|nr:hypothetical protein FXO37_21445 [Capsicum annuum]
MTNIVSSFEPVLDPTRTLPPPISSLEKSTLTFIPRTPTTAAPKWVVLLSNRSFELGFVRVGYFDLRWLREMVVENLILLSNSPGKRFADHKKTDISNPPKISGEWSRSFTEKQLTLEGPGPEKRKVAKRESVIT